MEAHQSRKLNSFNCINEVLEDNGDLIIILEAAYSWTSFGMQHTRRFKTFNDALAALRKFK